MKRERDRRGSTSIRSAEKILPGEMDLFWALRENKMNFQQFFIEWCVKNHSSNKTVYFEEHIQMISQAV